MTRTDLDRYKQQIRTERNEASELLTQIAEHTETMKTIANLFSNSVWKLLPNSIKQYFSEYRSE